MNPVNMREAKTRFCSLVKAVESDAEKEVVITRNGKPVARIVPLAKVDVSKRIGIAKGLFRVRGNLDEHEDEIAALFNDGEIFPEIDS